MSPKVRRDAAQAQGEFVESSEPLVPGVEPDAVHRRQTLAIGLEHRLPGVDLAPRLVAIDGKDAVEAVERAGAGETQPEFPVHGELEAFVQEPVAEGFPPKKTAGCTRKHFQCSNQLLKGGIHMTWETRPRWSTRTAWP